MKTAEEWLTENNYGSGMIFTYENTERVMEQFIFSYNKEIISLIDEMIEQIDQHKILVSSRHHNERKQSYELALT